MRAQEPAASRSLEVNQDKDVFAAKTGRHLLCDRVDGRFRIRVMSQFTVERILAPP